MQQTILSDDTVPNFTELFHDSPLAIYTCDKNGYINFFNRSAAELWNNTPEVGKTRWCGSWKIYHPDGKLMALDECPMALTLKQERSFGGSEIIIERPDHTFRTLLVFPKPIFNTAGVLTGAHNTMVDITSQKKQEEKQSILSAIVESSDDAIISKNLNGIITSWNKGAQKIFGYTEDEIIGKSVYVLIPYELQAEENVIITNIKAGKKIDHFQTVRLTKSGKKINISLTVSPVKDMYGNITGASKIARDITDQLQKEQALKQGAQRLEILNSIGKDIAGNLDTGYILQKVTDAATQITTAAFGVFFYNSTGENGEASMLSATAGIPKETFGKIGTTSFDELFGGKKIIKADNIANAVGYGKNNTHFGILNAQLPVVSYLAVPVTGSSGKVLGGLFLGHPEPCVFTTEHDELVMNIASVASVALDNSKLFDEVKALNNRKDEFIALASHELKTPVTTIKGYLQILQQNETGKLGQLFLEKSLRQVNKLTSLISDLLDVSKIEAGKLQLNYETFDLHALMLDIIETIHYSNSTHTIILDAAPAQALIEADKQRIEQAVVNLLTNAIKYSPGADKVFVSLASTANGTTINVKDNGIGLTEEQQQHIFTRFYRADGNSNISGLGLGLYLTKEIIDRHHGQIFVKSEMGKGSEFSFFIPSGKPAPLP